MADGILSREARGEIEDILFMGSRKAFNEFPDPFENPPFWTMEPSASEGLITEVALLVPNQHASAFRVGASLGLYAARSCIEFVKSSEREELLADLEGNVARSLRCLLIAEPYEITTLAYATGTKIGRQMVCDAGYAPFTARNERSYVAVNAFGYLLDTLHQLLIMRAIFMDGDGSLTTAMIDELTDEAQTMEGLSNDRFSELLRAEINMDTK